MYTQCRGLFGLWICCYFLTFTFTPSKYVNTEANHRISVNEVKHMFFLISYLFKLR